MELIDTGSLIAFESLRRWNLLFSLEGAIEYHGCSLFALKVKEYMRVRWLIMMRDN